MKGITEFASRIASLKCGLYVSSRLNVRDFMTARMSELFLYPDAMKAALKVSGPICA